MKKSIDFIAKVEDFINKRDNGEFVFTEQATKMKYLYANLYELFPNTPDERARRTFTLADCLSFAIKAYIYRKNEKSRLELAEVCYYYIDRAWNNGAVVGSDKAGLKNLAECRTENEELQKKLADLSKKYLDVKNKLEKYEQHFQMLDKEHRRN